jgi:hypothetical protein
MFLTDVFLLCKAIRLLAFILMLLLVGLLRLFIIQQ